MNLSDEEIRKGCLRNSSKAQKALFMRYHGVFQGICLRYGKDRAEVEDVLIEGFTRIYKNMKSYNGKGSFEGWMKRIIINTAIDNFRKNKKHYYHEDILEYEDKFSQEPLVIENFSVEDILKTIQDLPPGYRIVFNLYAIEGFSHKEIAEKLGISANTSKTQLLKARKKLQVQLKQLKGAVLNLNAG